MREITKRTLIEIAVLSFGFRSGLRTGNGTGQRDREGPNGHCASRRRSNLTQTDNRYRANRGYEGNGFVWSVEPRHWFVFLEAGLPDFEHLYKPESC